VLAFGGEGESGSAARSYLIVDLVYDRQRLETGLSALEEPNGTRYLPLRRVSLALGYRLQVNAVLGRAKGFLGTPKRRLDLTVTAGVAKRAGEQVKFAANQCFEQDGDLYVESGLLAKLLEVSLDWRMTSMELLVASPRKLPTVHAQPPPQVQPPTSGPQRVEKVSLPYRVWSPPQVDLRMRSETDLNAYRSVEQRSAQLTAYGDLAYMSGKVQLITDQNGRPREYLTLGRTDPGRGLLGPLQATRVALGDFTMPTVPMISVAKMGYGFSVSNEPLDRRAPGTVKIQGLAPPGSRVEVYLKGEMAASAEPSEAGRYEVDFRAPPGAQSCTVVTVDPAGNVKEETRTVISASEGPLRGVPRYDVYAGLAGRTLLGAPAYSFGTPRFEAGAELSSYLTSSSWLTTSAGVRGDAPFLGLGWNGWLGDTFARARATGLADGGGAIGVSVARSFGHLRLSFGQTVASKPMQDLRTFGGGITSATTLSLSGITGGRDPLAYSFDAFRVNGWSPSTYLRACASRQVGKALLSTSLTEHIQQSGSVGRGLIQARRSVGSGQAIAEFGYGLGSSLSYEFAKMAYDRALSPTYRMQIGLQNQAFRGNQSSAFATVYRSFAAVDLGVRVEAGTQGAKLALFASAAVDFSGISHRASFVQPTGASRGSIEAQVFLDRNMNGKFDARDELIQGASLSVAGQPDSPLTGKDGRVVLRGVPPDRQTTVWLNEDLLADPSWVSECGKYVVLARPGRRAKLVFPVVAAAEVNGAVVAQDTNFYSVALVDAKGALAGWSLLDDAGAFVLSRIAPGEYTLQVLNASGKVLKTQPLSCPFGGQVSGIKIVVP